MGELDQRLQGALEDLQGYLADNLAPLLVADAFETLLDYPPALTAEQLRIWSFFQYQGRGGVTPISDILYHAIKKIQQLETQLKGSVPAGATAATLVVAYEPVWAIGTGKTPTTPEVAAAHAHIRKVLGGLVVDAAGVRLLYGGSVKGSNAAELLAAGDVDGALIGGASLKADEFLAIAKAA